MNDYLNFIGYMTDRTIVQWEGKEFLTKHHSTYKHTINFYLEGMKPNLLSIGFKNVEGSPNSIYCPEFHSLSQFITTRSVCVVKDNQLIIDDTIRIVCLLIPEQIVEPTSLEQINQAVSLQYKQLMIQDVLTKNNPYQNNSSILPFYEQVIIEKNILLNRLFNQNLKKFRDTVYRLIGLGVGLTPSGDDYLTGLMLSLSFLDTDFTKEIKSKWQEVVQEKLPTNDVSEQQLYFSSFGRSKQYVILLINSIVNEDVMLTEFERYIKDILSIGSTSGFDLLLGISDGINLIKEMR